MDIKQIAENTIREEANSLLELIPQIDNNFEDAVRCILNIKGHVITTGVGKSGHIAAKVAATLASTGTPSFYLNALDALHGDLGIVTSDDLLLLFSNSGTTDEILRIIASVEGLDIPIVSVTGNPDSIIAHHSDHHISSHVEREACPLGLAPTSSSTAAMVIGDALACALMELRRFKPDDFAMFHPGGSIGHKLLTHVRDVMYTENFPIVQEEMKLSDAIIHISNGKLGLGVVLHDEKVCGIITDGDIRRAVEGAKSNFLNLSVSDVMTRTPKTIHPEAKLTEIQRMFRKHKIHSLLVTDNANHLLGIVDYFTIMN